MRRRTKTEFIGLRISPTDKQLIEAYAIKKDMTVSQAIVSLIRQVRPFVE